MEINVNKHIFLEVLNGAIYYHPLDIVYTPGLRNVLNAFSPNKKIKRVEMHLLEPVLFTALY